MRILIGVLLFALFLSAPANARDGWQGHPVCDAARVADHEHWHGFVTNGEIK